MVFFACFRDFTCLACEAFTVGAVDDAKVAAVVVEASLSGLGGALTECFGGLDMSLEVGDDGDIVGRHRNWESPKYPESPKSESPNLTAARYIKFVEIMSLGSLFNNYLSWQSTMMHFNH